MREDVDDGGWRHDLEPGEARSEPRCELEGVEAEGDGEQADRVVDCATGERSISRVSSCSKRVTMDPLSERGLPLCCGRADRRTCRRMDRMTPVADLAHSSLDGGLDGLVCLVCNVRHGGLDVIEREDVGSAERCVLAEMSEVRSTCEQVRV